MTSIGSTSRVRSCSSSTSSRRSSPTGSAEVWAGRILDLVLDTAVDVHAVIVMRADQYGSLAAIPSLAALVEDAQVVVGPPTDDELRRIIEVPARRTGCHVEPALIDMVADDVAGHDAALPLVSAALAEVWGHRVGNTLTADGYARLGGLSAAVERMGARAVQRAGGEQGVREVMLRLVDVTEDGQWVRRRVPVDDVPADLADRRRRPRRCPLGAARRRAGRRRPRGRVPRLAPARLLARGGPRRARPGTRAAFRRPGVGRRRPQRRRPLPRRPPRRR